MWPFTCCQAVSTTQTRKFGASHGFHTLQGMDKQLEIPSRRKCVHVNGTNLVSKDCHSLVRNVVLLSTCLLERWRHCATRTFSLRHPKLKRERESRSPDVEDLIGAALKCRNACLLSWNTPLESKVWTFMRAHDCATSYQNKHRVCYATSLKYQR